MTGRTSLIVDANIFVEGLPPGMLGVEYELLMPPEVEYEIRSKGAEAPLDLAISAGLRICSPTEHFMEIVERAARKTGDDLRLSYADRVLLALALEEEGEIMTDDYSVQNLAQVLGIPIKRGLQKGIEQVFRWQKKCTGCGKAFEEGSTEKDCPVCGSGLKVVRLKE